MLIKLYLDRLPLDRLPLGALNQTLRLLGKLSTLYVLTSQPWSETSSQGAITHAAEGMIQ